MFILKMETENAAFEDKCFEVSRILRKISRNISEGQQTGIINDINGNRVGDYSFVVKEIEEEVEEA
jgi:hypothetical protein